MSSPREASLRFLKSLDRCLDIHRFECAPSDPDAGSVSFCWMPACEFVMGSNAESAFPNKRLSHPEGPGSSIAGRENHPMVHIAWEDVNPYAAWAGKRLPTQAESEFAPAGGNEGQR